MTFLWDSCSEVQNCCLIHKSAGRHANGAICPLWNYYPNMGTKLDFIILMRCPISTIMISEFYTTRLHAFSLFLHLKMFFYLFFYYYYLQCTWMNKMYGLCLCFILMYCDKMFCIMNTNIYIWRLPFTWQCGKRSKPALTYTACFLSSK